MIIERAAFTHERTGHPDTNWLVTFHRTIARSSETPLSAASIPFEHLYRPFVNDASERVRWPDSFPQTSLEQYLLQQLDGVASAALGTEFSAFRATRLSKGSYEAFLHEMQAGGWLAFVDRYPVAARYIATTANRWVTNTNLFLSRLANEDFPAHHGTLESIEPGLSDLHHGGKSSMRLRFADGFSCIYKPKSVNSEVHYLNLLRWLNDHGLAPGFYVHRVLDREGYGWADAVEQKPCSDSESVRRYFHCAGQLICLLYLLEATDCHAENLIAHGDCPVLVDMETLLYPRVHSLQMIDNLQDLFYWRSVFRTAMLPRWEFGKLGAYDISGLGALSHTPTSATRDEWVDINTDYMRLQKKAVTTGTLRNAVVLNGEIIHPRDHADEIATGFAAAYDFLAQHREGLIAGPLAPMAVIRSRFLYRSTRVYAAIRRRCLQPENLTDGAATSRQADLLCRALAGSSEQHPHWAIVNAERKAVLEGDVPLFHCDPESRALELEPGLCIPDFFESTGFERVRRNLRELSDTDKQRQISFIRAAFQSAPPAAASRIAPPTATLPSTHEVFIDDAFQIAERIREAAIIANDGTASWLTMAFHTDQSCWQIEPASVRLYDGVSGIALFLAALEYITGNAGYHSLTMAALRSTTDAIREPQVARDLLDKGIGAGTGIASIAYALARCAQWLSRDELLSDALRVTDLIEPEEDRRYDLLSGAAGAIVVLLAIHRIDGAPWLIDKAVACANHLLRHQSKPGEWINPRGQALTGFAHGAAGIAYPLTRLYAITGDDALREAALAACDFESRLYSETLGTWLDHPHDKGGAARLSSWCHGAPGITLGRLAMLPHVELHDDINRGLARTLADPPSPIDHPCCGNLGRAETLLFAGDRLHRPDLIKEARRIAHQARTKGYATGWDSGPLIPSFHQGFAGIGYQLLRLAEPQRLPSILLWE